MNTNEKITKRKITQLEKNAAALAAQNDWKKAAATLLPVAQAAPQDTQLWLRLAQWQRSAHEFREAIQTLQTALKNLEEQTSSTRPLAADTKSLSEREQLHLQIAENFAEMQDWAACIKAANALLEIAPRNHNARELLATSFLHSGQVPEAEMMIRELLRMSPRDPLHRLKLATLLQIQGKSGEALEEFNRVVAAHPDAPFANEAREAIEMLDNLQIQHVMMRLSEQPQFEYQMRLDLESTLREHGFHLTDEGRESLRHMMSDGRPEVVPPKIVFH